MLKSYAQQRIEAAHEGRDIAEILAEYFKKHRGKRHISTAVAGELDVSDQTIQNWCRDLEIDLTTFR